MLLERVPDLMSHIDVEIIAPRISLAVRLEPLFKEHF